MNLSSAAIVLRERSALELLDLSLRFVRALAPLSYWRLSTIVLLPLFAGCLLLRYVLQLDWGWVWLAAWIGSTLAQGPFALLAGRLLFRGEVRMSGLLLDFLRRVLAYVTLLLLRTALFLLSLPTLVGPAVIWAYTIYLHEAVYLEGAGIKAALGRSGRIVRGRSGSSIELLFCISCVFLAAIVVSEVLGLVLLQFVFEIDLPVETLAEDAGSVFSLAGFFSAVPLASTLRFLFYVNERTLRDGWDVQVRFLGIKNDLEQRAG